MIKEKAEKLIKRKIAKLKPCPFCGNTPEVKAYCDSEHSSRGSFGHFAIRRGCCKLTGSGQTELFFCNNWKEPDYALWWNMACRLIDDWNERFTEKEMQS